MEWREEYERTKDWRLLYDYPMSWSFWRALCVQHGEPDPGPDRLPEDSTVSKEANDHPELKAWVEAWHRYLDLEGNPRPPDNPPAPPKPLPIPVETMFTSPIWGQDKRVGPVYLSGKSKARAEKEAEQKPKAKKLKALDA